MKIFKLFTAVLISLAACTCAVNLPHTRLAARVRDYPDQPFMDIFVRLAGVDLGTTVTAQLPRITTNIDDIELPTVTVTLAPPPITVTASVPTVSNTAYVGSTSLTSTTFTRTVRSVTRTLLITSRSSRRPTVTRTVTASNTCNTRGPTTHLSSTAGHGTSRSVEVTKWLTVNLTSTVMSGVDVFTRAADDIITVTGGGGLWRAGAGRVRSLCADRDPREKLVVVLTGLMTVPVTVRLLF